MVFFCPDGWACGLPDPGEEVEDRHRFLQGTQERKLSLPLEGNRLQARGGALNRHHCFLAPWLGVQSNAGPVRGDTDIPRGKLQQNLNRAAQVAVWDSPQDRLRGCAWGNTWR